MTEKELKLVSVLLGIAYSERKDIEVDRAKAALLSELASDSEPATKSALDAYARAVSDHEWSLGPYYSSVEFVRPVRVPDEYIETPVTDRKDYCESCGSLEKLQGHHEDYSRPGETVTLCSRCHRRAHNGHGVWVWRVEQ